MRPGTVHPERLAKPLSEFRVRPEELLGEPGKVELIDPVNAQAQFGLARSYLLVRHMESAALTAVSASLSLVFHNPPAHHLRGVALARLQRYDEAIAAFQIAGAQNSVYPAAHRRLARLHRRGGNTTLADQHLALARFTGGTEQPRPGAERFVHRD
jgi:predicted Zn-dependent protease